MGLCSGLAGFVSVGLTGLGFRIQCQSRSPVFKRLHVKKQQSVKGEVKVAVTGICMEMLKI